MWRDVHTHTFGVFLYGWSRGRPGWAEAGANWRACSFLVPAGAQRPACWFSNSNVLFSGTRWAARSRPSTMSWRGANGSCTCSFIPTGRREPTPRAARRGSANKTLPTEVNTPPCNLLDHNELFPIFYLPFIISPSVPHFVTMQAMFIKLRLG